MRSWLLASVLVLTACDRSPAPSTSTATSTPPGNVDGAQAKKLVSEGAKLVDVRTAEEFAEKHVPGAENIPVDVVGERDLGPKDKAIVLYCHSGRRSAHAADMLRAKGYTKVYDLGGMSSWPE